jgi:hypothetical protein
MATDLNIPRPEDESAELSRLITRQAELTARLLAISEEQRAIHAEASAQTPPDPRKDRIAAVIEGASYQAPFSHQMQMAALADERRDVREAVDELSVAVRAERDKASRAIVERYVEMYREICAEFYKAILSTANAHTKLGELRRQFRRSGIDPVALVDVGRDFFGTPLDRANDGWIALRRAARDGLIKATDIPQEFR